MHTPQSPLTRLLIASAIDPAVYRRLVDSPEATFDEYVLPESDRELLRHPDHRLLPALGAALAENAEQTAAAPRTSPPATLAPRPSAAAHAATLPDLTLVLTVQPCAQYESDQLRNFAYAVWVTPLPEGADPATLPPPAGTVFPGRPLTPLRAIIRVNAIQLQDPAGNPLVGLTAALFNNSNIAAPPPSEAAGNAAGSPFARDLQTPEVQSAIAAVRSAPAADRYERLLNLLHILHPEATA